MSEQETDILVLLQKMQQQLTYLEKKLDTLLQKSEQKPQFNRDRNFSRPFRPFGARQGHQDSNARGNSFSGRPHGMHRNDRSEGKSGQGETNGNFAPKKHHFGRRKDRD